MKRTCSNCKYWTDMSPHGEYKGDCTRIGEQEYPADNVPSIIGTLYGAPCDFRPPPGFYCSLHEYTGEDGYDEVLRMAGFEKDEEGKWIHNAPSRI